MRILSIAVIVSAVSVNYCVYLSYGLRTDTVVINTVLPRERKAPVGFCPGRSFDRTPCISFRTFIELDRAGSARRCFTYVIVESAIEH